MHKRNIVYSQDTISFSRMEKQSRCQGMAQAIDTRERRVSKPMIEPPLPHLTGNEQRVAGKEQIRSATATNQNTNRMLAFILAGVSSSLMFFSSKMFISFYTVSSMSHVLTLLSGLLFLGSYLIGIHNLVKNKAITPWDRSAVALGGFTAVWFLGAVILFFHAGLPLQFMAFQVTVEFWLMGCEFLLMWGIAIFLSVRMKYCPDKKEAYV